MFRCDQYKTVKMKFSTMDKTYSATYQITSTNSGKTNGNLEIMKFTLILKPESKKGCNFYVFASNQQIHIVYMSFLTFF